MRISAVFSFAALVVLWGPAVARADAVPSPPADCPSGAIGATSHYGTHCRPDGCTSDEDCGSDVFGSRPAGRTCRPAAFCVRSEVREHPRGNTSRELFIGPCAADGSCAEGECRRQSYCLDGAATSAGSATMATDEPPTMTEPPAMTEPASMAGSASAEDDGEGGCSLVPGARAGARAAGMLLVGALLFMRRQRGGTSSGRP